MGQRKQLKMFDHIEREFKDSEISKWKGNKGLYVFKTTGENKVNRPITQVYLNRQYMTGLFKSKKNDEYTGDIKEVDRKRYLIFKVIENGKIDIFERV